VGQTARNVGKANGFLGRRKQSANNHLAQTIQKTVSFRAVALFSDGANQGHECCVVLCAKIKF
jgi:hypothetical protein